MVIYNFNVYTLAFCFCDEVYGNDAGNYVKYTIVVGVIVLKVSVIVFASFVLLLLHSHKLLIILFDDKSLAKRVAVVGVRRETKRGALRYYRKNAGVGIEHWGDKD